MTFISEVTKEVEQLVDPLIFGESITYIAKQRDYIEEGLAPGAGEKTINARVVRDRPNPTLTEGGDIAQPVGGASDIRQTLIGNALEFYILKDATKGIADPQIGTDKVKIPLDRGGTPVTMRVTKKDSQGFGLWKLEAEA